MKRKILPVMLTASLVGTLLPGPALAATPYQDVQGHWGQNAVERWSGYGVVSGDSGQFRPDDTLTRGEMAVIIANLLKLEHTTEENPFLDLGESWYTNAMLACHDAGIFSGDAAGTIRPGDTITRQEAMVVLGNALRIAPEKGDLEGFADGAAVADWAKGYVKALTEAQIVNGVGADLLQPVGEISRASVVTILNNAITGYANQDGASVAAQGGIVIVAGKDVKVSGEANSVLVLDEAAKGQVTLENLKVSGSVSVDGAETKVVLAGETKTDSIAFHREAADSALIVEKSAAAGNVSVEGPRTAVEIQGTAGKIEIGKAAEQAKVTVAAEAKADSIKTDGIETEVSVAGVVDEVALGKSAEESKIMVKEGAEVAALDTKAPKTEITVQGKVADVKVSESAAETSMKVESTGKVEEVATQAEKVTISGKGEVEKVTVSGDQTAIDTSGTKVDVEKGTEGVTENGSKVDDGKTVTTDEKKESSGGGGSSDSSSKKKYTVTFTLSDGQKTYAFSERIVRGSTTDAALAGELKAADGTAYALPAGQQITWYDANGKIFNFAATITEETAITGVVGSNAFAGGNGTSVYPYLIGSAAQYAAIGNYSTDMAAGKAYHFVLTGDIDAPTGEYVTEYFCGTLDGQNHTITAHNGADADDYFTYYTCGTSEFKDLTLKQTNTDGKAGVYALVFSAKGENSHLTYNHIISTGEAIVGNNESPYIVHQTTGTGTVTFKDCVNKAKITTAVGSWAGVFVGGASATGSKLVFENCVNEGTLQAGYASMFLGNYYGNLKIAADQITVTNCSNRGMIRGTKAADYFTHLDGGDKAFADLNEACKTSVGGTVEVKADVTITIQKDGNGFISVSATGNDAENIASYGVVLQASTRNNDSETYMTSITPEQLGKDGGAVTLKPGIFILKADFETLIGSDKTATYTPVNEKVIPNTTVATAVYNGNLYYVFDEVTYNDKSFSYGANGVQAEVLATAYDADGNVLGAAQTRLAATVSVNDTVTETTQAEEDKAVPEEDKTVTEEDKTVTEEDKTVTEEDKTVTEEDKTVTEEDKTVTEEDKTVTEEDKTVPEEDKAVTEEGKKEEAVTPQESITPEEGQKAETAI